MFILDKELSPSKKPLAIIGLAEKGYVTLRITAKGQGGHSSMPPAKTALGSLGLAVAALEKNQMRLPHSSGFQADSKNHHGNFPRNRCCTGTGDWRH